MWSAAGGGSGGGGGYVQAVVNMSSNSHYTIEVGGGGSTNGNGNTNSAPGGYHGGGSGGWAGGGGRTSFIDALSNELLTAGGGGGGGGGAGGGSGSAQNAPNNGGYTGATGGSQTGPGTPPPVGSGQYSVSSPGTGPFGSGGDAAPNEYSNGGGGGYYGGAGGASYVGSGAGGSSYLGGSESTISGVSAVAGNGLVSGNSTDVHLSSFVAQGNAGRGGHGFLIAYWGASVDTAYSSGTTLTITGFNLTADTTVKVGTVSCTPVVFVSSDKITCTLGAGSPSIGTVTVTVPGYVDILFQNYKANFKPPTGKVISTFSTGLSGSAFNQQGTIAVDSSGNLYVAGGYWGQNVVKITPQGVATSYGSGGFNTPGTVTTDASGNVYFGNFNGGGGIYQIASGGATTHIGNTGLNLGLIAADPSGNIYYSSNSAIYKMISDGSTSVFAGVDGTSGNLDGTGSNARFNNPKGLFADSSGNLYVADTGNSEIRKITPAGVVTTIAGQAGSGNVDGPNASAKFSSLGYITMDTYGNLFVTDNGKVRMISFYGTVSTITSNDIGPATSYGGRMAGIAVDASEVVYVSDLDNGLIYTIQ